MGLYRSRVPARAWLNYGLGIENENLPAFVTDTKATTTNGPRN